MTVTDLLAVALSVGLSTSVAAQEPPDRPNVVVVFCDDLGYGDLSCYGHPNIRTPRLDAMAGEGVRLTGFYAAASVCTPSRAALLTGRYPIRSLPGNLGPGSKGGLPHDERTLAEALKERGYRTAAFGKWHLGSVPGYFPTDHGFDESFGLPYSNDMIPPWVNTQRPLHLYRGDQQLPEQPVEQTTLTRRYTEEAVRFIRANHDQPFFVYLPHSMPHLPISTSAAFTGKSRGGPYGDVIEEIDWSVGQILDVLVELDLDERTLVVFTSDNGPWRNLPPRMYDTDPVEKWHTGTTGPLRGAKATSYEGGFRVPAIVRWPGRVPAGRINGELMTTMDLFATIVTLAGCSGSPNPLDGRDVWNVLAADAPSPHEHFFYFSGRTLQAVRDQRYKLRIAKPDDDYLSPGIANAGKQVETQLYDLWSDPYERFNLAEQQPDRVSALKRKLVEMAETTRAKLLFEADG